MLLNALSWKELLKIIQSNSVDNGFLYSVLSQLFFFSLLHPSLFPFPLGRKFADYLKCDLETLLIIVLCDWCKESSGVFGAPVSMLIYINCKYGLVAVTQLLIKSGVAVHHENPIGLDTNIICTWIIFFFTVIYQNFYYWLSLSLGKIQHSRSRFCAGPSIMSVL